MVFSKSKRVREFTPIAANFLELSANSRGLVDTMPVRQDLEKALEYSAWRAYQPVSLTKSRNSGRSLGSKCLPASLSM